MHRALAGGHVQRVHAARIGARDVVLLQVRAPGQTRYVVAIEGLGVGVVDAGARERLREAMSRGAPRDKARWPEIVEAEVAREARRRPAGADTGPDDVADGGPLVDALLRDDQGGRREALRRALARTLARVERRAEAVRGDLERAEGAGELARRAQLFVVEASRAPRGASSLTAQDWSSGEAREVVLKLDPARPAQAQLGAMFERARRLKEGARIGRERLAAAEGTRAALVALAAELLALAPDADPAPLEARARAAAPRDFRGVQPPSPGKGKGPASAARQTPAPPYRTFTGPSGGRVLVGRSGERNDELTFHVARPHDLWLHAKGRTGAHVVVPLARNASCPADLLVEAAHLAAHFSESRDEDLVEVQYTPRRYLRKPRGSAPGRVVVDREKVMLVRREPELLRALLESEVG